MVVDTGHRWTRILAVLGLCGLGAAPAAAAPDPSGTWLTEDGRARIRVEPCGRNSATMCGYVVWLKAPTTPAAQPLLDEKNPDPKKAGRPLLGHQLILGLRLRDERYEGRIYNNEDGKSYNVTVWLERPNELKVKGCLIAFLCSTQDWTRTTDVLPGQLTGATGSAAGPVSDPEYAALAAPAGAARRETKARP